MNNSILCILLFMLFSVDTASADTLQLGLMVGEDTWGYTASVEANKSGSTLVACDMPVSITFRRLYATRIMLMRVTPSAAYVCPMPLRD